MSHLREKVKDLEEESHRLRMDLLEAQSNLEEAMSQIILSPAFLKRLIIFAILTRTLAEPRSYRNHQVNF